MRVTKKEIKLFDHTKYKLKHYRTNKQGSLLKRIESKANISIDQLQNESEIMKALEDLSFEMERGKKWSNGKVKCECKHPIYNLFNHILTNEGDFIAIKEELQASLEKDSIDSSIKELFKYSFRCISITYKEDGRLKDSIDFYKVVDGICNQNWNEDNPYFILYRDGIRKKILDRKKAISKSLIGNKIAYDYFYDKEKSKVNITPNSKRAKWAVEIVQNEYMKQNDSFNQLETSYQFDNLISLLAWKQEELSKSNKQRQNNSSEAHLFCIEMKNMLSKHEKDNLSFNPETPEDLRYYIEEVRGYFNHYFPLKSRVPKGKTDKRKENVINEKYKLKYTRPETIKFIVRKQIENKAVNHMIQMGKLYAMFDGKEYEKDVEITADDLQNFKVREASKKQIINMITEAIFHLSYQFGHKAEQRDVLSDIANDYNKKVKENQNNLQLDTRNFEILSEQERKKRLNQYFNIDWNTDKVVERIENILLASFHSVNSARNNTFHYDIEGKDIIDLICAEPEHKIPEIKELFENDLKQMEKAIIEKIQSSNIPLFYEKETIEKILDKFHISISPNIYPFMPSFKKVYEKGMYMQQAKRMDLSIFKEQSDHNLPYRNLLKYIYKYDFLPSIREKEDIVSDWIDHVIENNRKTAQMITKAAFYKYEKIPPFTGSLSDFFGQLQSMILLSLANEQEIVPDDNKKLASDTFNEFLQDLISYSFNNFVKEKYDNLLTYECNESGYITLRDKEIILDNMPMGGFEEHVKINTSLSNDLDLSKFGQFYIFTKLAHKDSLGLLSNELMKFRVTQKDTKDNKDIAAIDTAMELIQLAMLVKPNIQSYQNDQLDKSYYDDLKKFYNYDCDYNFKNEFFQGKNFDMPIKFRNIEFLKSKNCLEYYQKFKIGNLKISKEDFESLDSYISNGDSSIKVLQENNKALHKKLVKSTNKEKLEEEIKEYRKNIEKINTYNNLAKKIYLIDLSKVYQIHMEILGRLIGFINDFERDLFFFLNYLNEKGLFTETSQLENRQIKSLFQYGIECCNEKTTTRKVRCFLNYNSNVKEDFILKTFFSLPKDIGYKGWTDSRNDIAHLQHIKKGADITKSVLEYINNTRILMSYDRKRKNAVAKSIIDIFEKHNLIIKFNIDDKHQLIASKPFIKSQAMTHLKNLKLSGEEAIRTDFHSDNIVQWLKKIMVYKK